MIRYIICNKENHSSASCNRVRLFERGFNDIGYDCKVLYLDFGSNRIQKMFAVIKHNIGLFRLALKLSKKDVVIICGETPLTLVYGFLAKRTNFIIERTEYPLYQIVKNYPPISYRRSVRNTKYYCKADGLIVCSTALKRCYSEYNKEIFISPLIVDLSEFKKQQTFKRPIDDKYIAYCGSLNNNKDGVPILIQSFAKFHKVHKDTKLVIIGSGSDASITELNNLIISLDLRNYVILTGAIPHSEMPAWLTNAEMLALARPNNKQAEGGMPSKVGEYLSSGVPCVITDVGDLHLYLKDARDCYMAEPDSVESFAEKMLECYGADNSELVKRAQETAKQFDCAQQARQLGEYLKQRFPSFETCPKN